MLQVNLSEKQAREFYDFCLRVAGVQDNPVIREMFSTIERQILPDSTNKAEFAVWRSKRITPAIVEAWKRKNGSPNIVFANGEPRRNMGCVVLGEYADLATGRMVTVMHHD